MSYGVKNWFRSLQQWLKQGTDGPQEKANGCPGNISTISASIFEVPFMRRLTISDHAGRFCQNAKQNVVFHTGNTIYGVSDIYKFQMLFSPLSMV
jgi:hypothetical protein